MEPYEKLKKIRISKCMTTYELSELTGIPQSSISKMENGKRKIETDSLKKLANALNVSVNEFFDEDIETTKEKTDKSIKNDLPVIPKEFTNPDEARAYVDKHRIFGANGFDSDKLSDDEILEFANELLKQMELISFKYKK
ncbi:helix-turn-helix domain-containing protein [Clostridium cochlearium]|uniref:Helix-turn-helix transcriptional regulator n=1 Tax=Clostridium cochlearium TaxID=1494 RepID=A0A7Y3V504_CLOCO|nr:helix-turn-helix transcriptional regulator [Clostridium cochlearium]NOH14833.1 helix-turn-helix transcriptional regulator [Clostridium cochlearium]